MDDGFRWGANPGYWGPASPRACGSWETVGLEPSMRRSMGVVSVLRKQDALDFINECGEAHHSCRARTDGMGQRPPRGKVSNPNESGTGACCTLIAI